ncbi:hypothetical protein H8R29_23455 [Priestia megaterium]|uniref:Uncharacterized protein n=1 Tax=Priestia megaterium (strain ATCC 14581 / DSM 32 / CCUG 1817 / JCM 2506 / NBRC 15308 / NCIMB 9376 / NCTC 10342 / NRRL B-14308 / VKM B-512 / Ford 19) TaxID=1348623 RepID=A0A0B6ARQ6_PRIM2|nr:hypothetical protein [Priestia megaterium]AJI22529.1 hypothetical protein BG04_1420 [Priestia megaterium NBRC 15308 = ATCC 14581]KGJ84252.1 hypothetical protein BMT_13335 [Priestia megaterium NBRC 15308 = ATCC 14581]MDR4230475.1 hypothetical protein [Priestia megaterium]MED3805628.1 hypothetical protein [Priestia megaterium]MED4396342.1 hypothetical protein [Priestia megaterium]
MFMNGTKPSISDWSFDDTPKYFPQVIGQQIQRIFSDFSSSLTSTLLWEEDQRENALSDVSSEMKISYLEKLYVFTDNRLVEKFLTDNPFLIKVLFEAFFQIQEIFPQDVQLKLDLQNGDDVAESEKLYLLISTNIDIDDAYDLLDTLDGLWWIQNASKVKEKMNIDLEI